ncbi:hypothetical protein ABE078_24395 [Priestia megaterium]
MSLSAYIIENEKVFKGAQDIKYLFMPASKPSKHLIVVFSGFNGKEEEGVLPYYNYVKYLKDIDCHRLFILDQCLGHPCYYLGHNKKLDYEVSVASLIYSISNEYKIMRKNIMTAGSSKGGSAAVYFALKYDFGHVIAGGFQFKVGEYLYTTKRYTRQTVLKVITGGNTPGHKDYLDRIYVDLVEKGTYTTNINVHVGSGDSHYEKHIKPFIGILQKRNIPYNLDVQDYSEHGKVGVYFSQYLIDQVSNITGQLVIKEAAITNEDQMISVSCSVPQDSKEPVHFAYYVFKQGQADPVKKVSYSPSAKLRYKVEHPGKYSVKVFVKKGDQKVAKRTPVIEV